MQHVAGSGDVASTVLRSTVGADADADADASVPEASCSGQGRMTSWPSMGRYHKWQVQGNRGPVRKMMSLETRVPDMLL
jgi:hypothetical protein